MSLFDLNLANQIDIKLWWASYANSIEFGETLHISMTFGDTTHFNNHINR